MEPMSIVEKVTTVFHLILSNSMSILACVLVIALGVGLFYSKKLPYQKQKKMIGLVYGAILTIVLLRFASPILTLFNHLMQQLALVFYFPDIVTYIVMFLTSNVILVRSIIKEDMDPKKKGINIIGFTCILLLFVLVMKEIMVNHIDVYTVKDLYQDQNIMASLQLSTCLFLGWMAVSGLYSMYQKLMTIQPTTVPVTEKIGEAIPVVTQQKKQARKEPEVASPYFSGFEPLLQKKEKTGHLWKSKQPIVEESTSVQPIMEPMTIETSQVPKKEEPTNQPNEELLMQNIQAMIKGNDPKLTLEEYRRMRGMLLKNNH